EVLKQYERTQDGKPGLAERRDDPVLTIDGVRRGQELARRLPAQNILAAAGRHVIGRIRLATAELAHLERAAEAFDVGAQVTFERGDVESVRFLDLGGLRDHLAASPLGRASVSHKVSGRYREPPRPAPPRDCGGRRSDVDAPRERAGTSPPPRGGGRAPCSRARRPTARRSDAGCA